MTPSDDMKRLQIRDFLASLTESERLRIIEGFVSGMFGPPDPPKARAAAAGSRVASHAEIADLIKMVKPRR